MPKQYQFFTDPVTGKTTQTPPGEQPQQGGGAMPKFTPTVQNPKAIYSPGQDMGPIRYSMRDIDYYDQLYKSQGRKMDPAWRANQMQLITDYHMSQPANTYWENPQNVGRWAAVMSNKPDNVSTPAWINKDYLGKAYDYFASLPENEGKPWWEWSKTVDPNDTARVFLREYMDQPDETQLPQWEQTFHQMDADIAASQQPLTPTGEQGSGAYGPAYTNPIDQATGGAFAGGDQPALMKAAMAVNSAAGNAAMLAAGPAMATVVGGPFAGGLAAVGSGLQYAAQKEQEATGKPGVFTTLANVFDVGAEGVERIMGVLNQLADNPAEVIANPSAAWQAGQYFYDTQALQFGTDLGAGNQGMPQNSQLPGANAQAEVMTTGQRVERWELGGSKPVEEWYTPKGETATTYLLEQARQGIMNGWTPDQAAQYIESRTGIGGQMSNLVGHMMLDPMNIMPDLVSHGVKAGADIAVKSGKGGLNAKLLSENFGRGSWLDDLKHFTQAARTEVTAAEAAKLPTLTKLVAGISDTGMLKDHLNPDQTRNAIANFFSPNRYSRAVALGGQAFDGFGRIVDAEATGLDAAHALTSLLDNSPAAVVNAADRMTYKTKVGGVEVDAPMPRYFQSAEGQGVVMAGRNALPDIKAVEEAVRTAAPKKQFIEDIARTHPDYQGPDGPARLIKDLAKADDATIQKIMTRWQQGLAVSPDPMAKTYLDNLSKGGYKASTFKDLVKPFAEGKTPFSDAEIKLALMDTLASKIDEFNAKYFGIKPDHWSIRLSKLVKTAQSYLLLGLNPSYAANNFITNLAHLAFDGLLDSSSLVGRRQFLDAFYGEYKPEKLKSAFGEMEAGMQGKEKSNLSATRKAAQAGDLIEKLDNLAKKPGKSKLGRTVLTPFATLSQAAESWASEIAMTHGIREYWNEVWDAGKGFDRIKDFDPQTAQVLDTFVPGGTRRIEQLIKRGLNKQQIEDALFKGFETPSIYDVMTPQDRNLANAFPDIFDPLDQKVRAAKTDAEVRSAIQDAQQQFAGKVKAEISRQTTKAVHEAIAKLGIDGSAQGLVDTFGGMFDDYNHYWSVYQSNMTDMWHRAEGIKDPTERFKFIDNEMNRMQTAFDAYAQRHVAQWYGTAQAFGGADKVPAEWLSALDLQNELAKEHSTFFLQKKDDFYKARALADAAADGKERQAIWDAFHQQTSANYLDMAGWEHVINRLFQDMSLEQVAAKQPQFAESYKAWIDSMYTTRLQAMAAENLFHYGTPPKMDAAGIADRFMKTHPELADKYGSRVHAVAEEFANAQVPPEIASAITALNHGLPEHNLPAAVRSQAREEFAKIRAAHLQQMLNAKNTPAGTVPNVTVKPADVAAQTIVNPTVLPEQGAPKAQPKPQPQSVYRASGSFQPIIDALTQAGKDIGEEPIDYLKNPYRLSKAAQAYAGKPINQVTAEDIPAMVEKWKVEHTKRIEDKKAKAEAKAAKAQTEGATTTPTEPAPVDQAAPIEPLTPEPAAPAPIPTEADIRARVVQAERDASAQLADSMGEFTYGRKDLETALRKTVPQQADDLLAVFDALAENFNPDLTSKAFYDRLGWQTGGEFTEGGAGLKQSVNSKELASVQDVLEVAQMRDFRYTDADVRDYIAQLKAKGKKYFEVWHTTKVENIDSILKSGVKQGSEWYNRPSSVYFMADQDELPKAMGFLASNFEGSTGNVAVVKVNLPIDLMLDLKWDNLFNMSFDTVSSFRIERPLQREWIDTHHVYEVSPPKGNNDVPGMKLLYQDNARVNGLTTFTSDMRALMRAYQSADASTFAHELIHGITPMMSKADADLVRAEWKRMGRGELPEDWHTAMTSAGGEPKVEPQWKYEDYSSWSRQIAETYTRAEINKEIGKTEGAKGRLGKSALRAIEKTSSMQSNSQHRAQTSNALQGNWERQNAYKNALEIYDFYPEKTKEGAGAPKVTPTGDQLTPQHTDVYEWLSRSFERYMAEGKAPTRKLAEVFGRIKDWMLDIYHKIAGSEIDVPVSEKVNEMFGKWMGADEAPTPEAPAFDWNASKAGDTLPGGDILVKRKIGRKADAKKLADETPNGYVLIDGDRSWAVAQHTLAPQAVTDIPGVKAEKAQPAKAKAGKAEKVVKAGYTRAQLDYIVGEIEAYMNAMPDAEINKKMASTDYRKFGFPRPEKKLVISVPDAGTLTIRDYDAANSVHQFLTGKKSPGFENGPVTTGGTTVATGGKLPAASTGDEWAAIRLYGSPEKAVEALRGQIPMNDTEAQGINTMKLSQAIMALEDMITGKQKPPKGQTWLDVAKSKKGTYLFQENTPIPDPIAAQAGTADSLTGAPLDMAALEGMLSYVDPMMKRWAEGMSGANRPKAFNMANLPPEAKTGLRRYLGRVYSQQADVKMGATRWGESKRNFALLDYSRRNTFDSLAGAIAPYQFWYTRSMMNWALRALERPVILSNYLRLQKFANDTENREGYPTRLKGKLELPFRLPWLPESAGNTTYIDPMRILYPFDQLLRPFEQYGQTMNMIEKRALSTIDYEEQQGQITPQEANEARTTRAGRAWEQAYTGAELDVRGDTSITPSSPMSMSGTGGGSANAMIQPGGLRNGLDFAFSLLSPSLPLSMIYAMATGRQDTVGLLPITKFGQTMTGMMGVNNGMGTTGLEGMARKAVGWPEQDRYTDYRLDAALAQLMAEGQITADQSKRAMMDRTGPVWQMAQQRVGQINPTRYFGAPLGVDIFPEGEKEVRALKQEYDQARTKWEAGDKNALSDFYEQHPEYDVRNFSFKTPDDRQRSYLISSIWEGWNAANSAEKKAMGKDELFQTAFVNKDTRSYDSLSTDQLAKWAGMLGVQPSQGLDTSAGTSAAPLVDAKVNPAMDAYDAEKKKLFPNISALYGISEQYPQGSAMAKAFDKAHPELGQYNQWRYEYLATHPDIAPLVTSETSKIYGQPAQVQQLYYQYEAQLGRQFPGIYDKQEAYFAISDKKQARNYLASHPELSEYWDWKRAYAAANPTVAPYIMSAQSLGDAITGKSGGGSGGGGYSYASYPTLPSSVYRTVMEHAKSGYTLNYGVENEIAAAMKSVGATGDQNAWLRGFVASRQSRVNTDVHPDVLNQQELAMIPPELTRALVALKFNGQQLGPGALAMVEQLQKRWEITTKLSTDAWVSSVLLPAIQ